MFTVVSRCYRRYKWWRRVGRSPAPVSGRRGRVIAPFPAFIFIFCLGGWGMGERQRVSGRACARGARVRQGSARGRFVCVSARFLPDTASFELKRCE